MTEFWKSAVDFFAKIDLKANTKNESQGCTRGELFTLFATIIFGAN